MGGTNPTYRDQLSRIEDDWVLTYTTEDKYVPRGRNSQANLSVDAVLDHYLRKSETDKTVGQLIGAVRDAQEEVDGDGDEDETVECGNCGEEVTPSVSVYRDPQTNRDHRQTTCPGCGEWMADGATGRMV